jgi:hypothetical protein
MSRLPTPFADTTHIRNHIPDILDRSFDGDPRLTVTPHRRPPQCLRTRRRQRNQRSLYRRHLTEVEPALAFSIPSKDGARSLEKRSAAPSGERIAARIGDRRHRHLVGLVSLLLLIGLAQM